MIEGSNGQSVKSIGEGVNCRAVNSAASSVNVGYVRVSIAGPAGTHGTFGAVAACAAGNPGRYGFVPKLGVASRDKATVKTRSNLNAGPILCRVWCRLGKSRCFEVVLKFIPENVFSGRRKLVLEAPEPERVRLKSRHLPCRRCPQGLSHGASFPNDLGSLDPVREIGQN